MISKTSERKIQLYSQPAKLLLSVLALCILIGNTLVLQQTNKLAELYSSQKNQATWFLFHLSKEFNELMFETTILADGNAKNLDTISLHYDLTWSRFDTMLSSRESDDFMSVKTEKIRLEEMFARFKELEPLMQAVSEREPESIQQFYLATKEQHQKVSDYINSIFRVSNPLLLEKQKQIENLNILQVVLLALFIACVFLIWFIFYQELRHSRSLAMTDPLTSLNNRFALFEESRKLNTTEQEFIVFLLDLNGFKQINDHYGHQAGDHVLLEVANRLKSMTNYNCASFRVGGDEFAIILQSCCGDCAKYFTRDVTELFSAPFMYQEQHLQLSTSLGSASYPKDSNNIDELIMLADQRMYKMKAGHGKHKK